MTDERASNRAERFALKAVTAASLSQAGGEHMAAHTTKSPAQLYRYGQRNDPAFAPLDVVLEIDRMAEQPIITTQLAASLGFRLVPVAAAEKKASLTSLISRFIGEASDVARTALDADEDGEHSLTEKRDILKELQELQSVITEIRRWVGDDTDA